VNIAQRCIDTLCKLKQRNKLKKATILGKIFLQGAAILAVLVGLTLFAFRFYQKDSGAIVPHDDKDALTYHIKHCSKGKIDNCFDAGVAYVKGIGAAPDTAKAATYF
jgi:TPR repeat protein